MNEDEAIRKHIIKEYIRFKGKRINKLALISIINRSFQAGVKFEKGKDL